MPRSRAPPTRPSAQPWPALPAALALAATPWGAPPSLAQERQRVQAPWALRWRCCWLACWREMLHEARQVRGVLAGARRCACVVQGARVSQRNRPKPCPAFRHHTRESVPCSLRSSCLVLRPPSMPLRAHPLQACEDVATGLAERKTAAAASRTLCIAWRCILHGLISLHLPRCGGGGERTASVSQRSSWFGGAWAW